MNRRGFFRGMLRGAMVAAAARYMPSVLEAPKVQTLSEWARTDLVEQLTEALERVHRAPPGRIVYKTKYEWGLGTIRPRDLVDPRELLAGGEDDDGER